MKPILYTAGTTDFTKNGVGVLSEAVSCVVAEERNGAYELELTYPVDGQYFSSILPDAIIKAKAKDTGNLQLFRIYQVSKPMAGIITVNAEHISYQLSYIPVAPFLASYADEALDGLVTNAAVNCPFTVWTNIPRGSAISFNNLLPASFRSNLAGREGSILDLYGGEYEFDNYAVKLWQSRGADNGVRITYGKNLIDLNQEENIAAAITGVYPYWTDGTTTVTLTEKVVQIQSSYGFPRVIPLDMSQDFAAQPSEIDLRAAATAYVNRTGISAPRISINVSFVALWQTAGYADIAPLEHVSLCDLVTVHMDKLGIDVKSKVIKTTYDTLKERYEGIDLGDARANLADTIAHQQEVISFVESHAITAGQVGDIVDEQTAWLNGGSGGNVFFTRNASGQPVELVWLDSNSLLTATNVFRININGLGFSSTGYGGTYKSAWTSDGKFSADFIRVGKILSSTGLFEFNLDSETITIKDANNNISLELDQNGNLTVSGAINAKSGKIGAFSIDANGNLAGVATLKVGGMTLVDTTINGVTDLPTGIIGLNNLKYRDIDPDDDENAYFLMVSNGELVLSDIALNKTTVEVFDTNGTQRTVLTNFTDWSLSETGSDPQEPEERTAVLTISFDGQGLNKRSLPSTSSQSKGFCNVGEIYHYENYQNDWARCTKRYAWVPASGMVQEHYAEVSDPSLPFYIKRTESGKVYYDFSTIML